MAHTVAIIGAGLTGLMAALHLAQRNLQIEIFDKRSLIEISSKGAASQSEPGRSMSMDISARGIFALQQVNCFDAVVSEAIPMTHRIFHDVNGNTHAIAYGKFEHEKILTVSRSHLFNTLIKKCRSFVNIKINFQHALIDIDTHKRSITILNHNTNHHYKIHPDIVIGADGINSRVRAIMELEGLHFESSHFPLSYKELTIPAACAHGFSLNAMHIWARNNAMLVAQPNGDDSFTCALLLSESERTPSFATIKSPQEIRALFETQFLDASQRMPNLEFEYFKNPVSKLTIIRGHSWSHQTFALVLGDAAHGMVPFFGQGVNCCFEDCTFLDQSLDRYGINWSKIISEFDDTRVRDANAINTMSYENYPELFAYHNFENIQLTRALEAMLMKEFRSYRSYHNLVCFDRVPYAFAQKVKQIQNQLLTRLCSQIESNGKIDSTSLKHELISYQHDLDLLKDPQ